MNPIDVNGHHLQSIVAMLAIGRYFFREWHWWNGSLVRLIHEFANASFRVFFLSFFYANLTRFFVKWRRCLSALWPYVVQFRRISCVDWWNKASTRLLSIFFFLKWPADWCSALSFSFRSNSVQNPPAYDFQWLSNIGCRFNQCIAIDFCSLSTLLIDPWNWSLSFQSFWAGWIESNKCYWLIRAQSELKKKNKR